MENGRETDLSGCGGGGESLSSKERTRGGSTDWLGDGFDQGQAEKGKSR